MDFIRFADFIYMRLRRVIGGNNLLTRNRPEGERFWCSERKLHYNDVHFHDYYELELVLEGVAKQSVNASSFELSEGSLLLLSPRDFHSIHTAHGKTVRTYTLGVCPEELTAEIKALLDAEGLPLVLRLDAPRGRRLLDELRSLSTAMSTDSPYRTARVRRKIELILLSVAEYAAQTKAEHPKAEDAHSSDRERDMYLIKQYLDEHYRESISRATLAEHLHYSPSYLSTLFCEVMGVTLSEYLLSVRLSHAYELLERGEGSVAEVIAAVGFRSHGTFYKKFRERYGRSPKER